MKKHLLLALIILATMACQQAMAQASTEGKEFWLASTIVCQPPTASKQAIAYVAVSAQTACSITITDYAGNSLATANVAAASWTEFGNTANTNTDPNRGPINIPLDQSKWYPTTNQISADDVYKHADEINNYGLHVTATEPVSVFVILRAVNSMDASNILPLMALQSEYYTQDVYPESHGVNNEISMITILATEDNTVVDITPNGDTYDKNNSGTTFNITLNKGQTYYVISKVNSQLAGTHIVARNNKKIAVYNGIPLTRMPTGVSARDGMYEQVMPVDYWGNQFIVTRSLGKDGNFIGVTAMENGTIVYINGYQHTILDAGQTYYCLLQGPADPRSSKPGDNPIDLNDVFTMDAIYIETSCPCAVFSYDTGNSFTGKIGSEILNGEGDPSSVWISPLQQRIGEITFGACYTDKTSNHFVNIVAETDNCETTTLTAYQNGQALDWTSMLTWTPVMGNTKYSYARLQIGNSQPDLPVFTLKNKNKFIAHVYGNGDDESYAYSCGSAAVKRGINLDDITFIDGTMGEDHFCINTPLEFDAQVGTDIIDKVDWDFGDGVTEYNGAPQTTHEYETKGWYDVTANVYAHKNCPATVYPAQAVHFSFYVDKAEIIKHETSICVPWDDPTPTDTITKTDYYDCDSIVITSTFVRRMSKPTDISITAKDSFLLNGEWLYESCQRSHTFMNSQECDSVVNYDVTIVHCLNIEVPKDINPECDETGVQIPFTYHKGEIDHASFVTTINGQSRSFPMTVSADNTYLLLDISEFTPGTVEGRIETYDAVCDQTLTFPITVFVRLPSSIMHQKYDNIVGITLEAINHYQLQGYQWLIDGVLQEGKNESIYYQDNSFVAGQSMEVMVLLPNGKWIQSCKLNLTGVGQIDNPFRQDDTQAPKRKMMREGNIYIQVGEQIFNSFGEKIK